MPCSYATNAEHHEEQSGEQFAEHNTEQCGVLLAVPNGAQIEEQDEKQPKSIQKKASSASCSAQGSATVAPQGGDNQQIYNIDNIIKEKNKKKKGSEPVQGAAGQYTTAELEAMFNQFRQAYKGTKRGLKVELENFKKKYNNWREIIPCLMPALEREIAWREQMQAAGQFVPQWAYLQTWINQARWENEFEAVQPAKGDAAQYNTQQAQTQQPPSDDEYGGSFGGVDC